MKNHPAKNGETDWRNFSKPIRLDLMQLNDDTHCSVLMPYGNLWRLLQGCYLGSVLGSFPLK